MIPIMLLTCSKEKYYEFQVINETDYDITEFHLDWCNGENKISVKSNESSEEHTLLYETSAANAFGPGSICVCVATYSHPSNSSLKFYNTCGIARTRDHLSTKNLNVIYISEDQEVADTICENNVFKYTFK